NASKLVSCWPRSTAGSPKGSTRRICKRPRRSSMPCAGNVISFTYVRWRAKQHSATTEALQTMAFSDFTFRCCAAWPFAPGLREVRQSRRQHPKKRPIDHSAYGGSHDGSAQGHRLQLPVGNGAWQILHAAVGGDHQPLWRHITQGLPESGRDTFRRFDAHIT